jgi:hypothetical protein
MEEGGSWRSPIAKFLSEDEMNGAAEALGAGVGDVLFISADQAWMDDAEKAGSLKPGSRVDLLRNALVLIASGTKDAGSDPEIALAPDLGSTLTRILGGGKLAMATIDAVPAGRYGKAALEKMKGQVTRKKVTFEWNADDVVDVIASAFRPGEENYKWIDFPVLNYASTSADMIVNDDGKMVGMSMFAGYSYNERCVLSLGIVEADVKEGDVLTLIWGEPDGGTGKTSSERPHKQAKIRVRVSPTPYAREARESYADSWRSKKK